ncbi:uncharacterized protein KGF55_005455 [Candida pseudojiufengensis]|uniref:uncharacterized protein n=1 Tax=Candida pseudojiufengensis TaxID=497109 RepID=UPI00222404C6|nr:uncharacterized protein KGF55_005455 [Candida pseudojiufengensis]KAI5959305.1 hypothetical protein KGF55_005455 [Candida pseudojiufengensis]
MSHEFIKLKIQEDQLFKELAFGHISKIYNDELNEINEFKLSIKNDQLDKYNEIVEKYRFEERIFIEEHKLKQKHSSVYALIVKSCKKFSKLIKGKIERSKKKRHETKSKVNTKSIRQKFRSRKELRVEIKELRILTPVQKLWGIHYVVFTRFSKSNNMIKQIIHLAAPLYKPNISLVFKPIKDRYKVRFCKIRRKIYQFKFKFRAKIRVAKKSLKSMKIDTIRKLQRLKRNISHSRSTEDVQSYKILKKLNDTCTTEGNLNYFINAQKEFSKFELMKYKIITEPLTKVDKIIESSSDKESTRSTTISKS